MKTTLTNYSAAFFLLFCTAMGKGYNYASALLLLCSLIALFPDKQQRISLPHDGKLFIATLIFYFFSFALTVFVTQNSISDLDNPSRALLAIPIFIALMTFPPRFSMLAYGLIAGAYLTGIVGIYYNNIYPEVRAFNGSIGSWWLKGHMPIQTAGMVTTLSITCLILSIYYLQTRNIMLALLALGGTLFAVYASLLSGSRGSWVSILMALLYLAYIYRSKFSKSFTITSILLAILFSVFILQSSTFKVRIEKAKADIELYLEEKNKYTSIGIRLEQWKSAYYTFKENPILGAGTIQRLQSRKAHGNAGLIDKQVSLTSSHAHNQFLESLSVYGVIGFSSLLCLFLVPIYLFENKRKSTNILEIRTLTQIGIVNIILMMGYCTTQAFLNHNSGIIFYIVFTSIFLAVSLTKATTHVRPPMDKANP